MSPSYQTLLVRETLHSHMFSTLRRCVLFQRTLKKNTFVKALCSHNCA